VEDYSVRLPTTYKYITKQQDKFTSFTGLLHKCAINLGQ